MLIAAILLATLATAPVDDFAAGFKNPPASAKPHTWWHWMDGNVTKEGITADLEAMKNVGIGGAQMFTVSQGIPPGPAGYMGPLWREMTKHAVKEAGRLGLELCLHNCAGWSSSGGPWVTPEHAMQVLAWSTKTVTGPMRFDGALDPIVAPHVFGKVEYSKDIAVYAFRGEYANPMANGSTIRDAWLGKTGVVRQDGLEPDLTSAKGPPIDSYLDITEKLKGGKLTWNLPEGTWTILRLGHVPTGKNNHPAPPEGDGLEVDKLSREAMDEFWSGTMATVIRDVGPLAGKVLNNALIDSYEVGSQNWTPKFREEFQKRRGYDCMPWMPALTGLTMHDKQSTERFLWDYRRTIADLYADNYFGYFKELCHRNGMLFSTEPYGNGGFDNIQCGGLADIPMGEFWLGGGAIETTKVASSAAHTNGRVLVGAESFTADEGRGKWLEEPYTAKAMGDLVFCNGINRYIFHRYAMQPWLDKVPGMTMGPWGTHLERTQTWWTEAATWLKYVARCQYLLQKGKFVADALYFYGEGAPADLPYRPGLKPRLPAGYDYDGCDASVIYRLRVRDGILVLPDHGQQEPPTSVLVTTSIIPEDFLEKINSNTNGYQTYRVLVLPESKFMTPPMAERIALLAKQGATIIGPKPTQSPSLTKYPECDDQVRRTDWSKITSGKSLEVVFSERKLRPDFEFKSLSGGSNLVYFHRRVDTTQIYLVSNQQYRPTEAECTFRVRGLAPELWHADTGVIEPAPIYREKNRRTVVPLRLGPAESVFVVFRHPDTANHLVGFERKGTLDAPKIPVIVIKSARYESEDGRGADVTAIVAQMLKEGQYEIPATNGAFGDPVVNVVKRLRIECTLDGKPMTKTVAENESLLLMELPPAQPAPYDVSASGGAFTVTPWKAGSFTAIAKGGRRFALSAAVPTELRLDSNWHLAFPSGWGAPASVELPKLISWPEHPNRGVRYFSGSAIYSRDFTFPASMVGKERALRLELGTVKNFATAKLNGRDLGVLWKEPFTYDVTGVVKPGKNHLEIKVTNLWPNRIIGDEQLPPDVEWNGTQLKEWPQWLREGKPRPDTGRFTFTTWRYYNKDSKLLESGLLGPVVLKSAKRIMVKM